jgi:hypothetical protein
MIIREERGGKICGDEHWSRQFDATRTRTECTREYGFLYNPIEWKRRRDENAGKKGSFEARSDNRLGCGRLRAILELSFEQWNVHLALGTSKSCLLMTLLHVKHKSAFCFEFVSFLIE